MVFDWENPKIKRGGTPTRDYQELDNPIGDGDSSLFSRRDGEIDPLKLFTLARQNSWQIIILTALFFCILFTAFMLVPFSYKATALVFVDPRQQAITPTQEVLPAIGTDAANLESVVQVVQSEGFLLNLLENLDLSGDTAFAALADPRERLKVFKKSLDVSRRGATYLVDIAYRSGDASRAAQYANAVAQTFVEQQNGAGVEAAGNASTSLSSRLVELRQNLRESEFAVAAFKEKFNIIDIDTASTLSQRQMSNSSEQISLARARTAEAKARYENQLAASTQNERSNGSATAFNELSLLQRDQKSLKREVAALRSTYGPKHPRLTAILEQMAIIDRQVQEERLQVTDSLRKVYRSALEEQAALETELTLKSETAKKNGVERVELADLERQAAANRAIYEQYLARFKATYEQTMLPVENVRIVSLALPPLNTTRPGLVLITMVLSVLAGVAALIFVMVRIFQSDGQIGEPQHIETLNNETHTSEAGSSPQGSGWSRPKQSEFSDHLDEHSSPQPPPQTLRTPKRASLRRDVKSRRLIGELPTNSMSGNWPGKDDLGAPHRRNSPSANITLGSLLSFAEAPLYRRSFFAAHGEATEIESLKRDVEAVRRQLKDRVP